MQSEPIGADLHGRRPDHHYRCAGKVDGHAVVARQPQLGAEVGRWFAVGIVRRTCLGPVMTYSYLPFMILPVYATLERMDLDLVDAAMDLGASRTTAFWDITWPLARAGIIAGCLLVFIPSMGEFVVPYLLGGPETLLIGRVLFDEFFVNRDWPLASAVAIMLLMFLVVPIVILQRNQARNAENVS